MGEAATTTTRKDLPGVLLVNLGTPDAPTVPALRRYLAEFLSDPDVVTLPRLLWLPLLHLVVLRTRPAKSAEAYAKVWTPEGSPLLVNSRALEAKLTVALQRHLGKPVVLALGMRYGNPSIASALEELRRDGATRLLVLPLYPQYAAATTASTFRAVTRALKRLGWSVPVQTLHDYHADPAYVAALAESVREHWERHGRAAKLMLSFHGIPQQVSDAGDPYARQCAVTAAALAKELKLAEDEWQATFQSRFGPAAWLKPYTEAALRECAAQGIKAVDVLCPGFAVDCLETLEEISLRYGESFRAAGGERLRYIPALNDRSAHVQALAGLATAELRKGKD
ncbi:MAG TPA: ferrochelatase [Gammaproteobacteria bacterium]|jgi:ferrochelatase